MAFALRYVVMVALFLVCSTSVSSSAVVVKSPSAPKPKERKAFPLLMLTHAQWKALSHVNQQLYLFGLQELANDLDRVDQETRVEYQTSDFNFLRMLIPEATAASDYAGKSCVYAGWVSKFDSNGRFCARPPQGSCKAHQVQCQPLLYGHQRCVPAGRFATQACLTNAKPLSEIAKELVNHEDEWNQFRNELITACKDPKESQIRVCAYLQTRLAEVASVVHFTPANAVSADAHRADVSDVAAPRARAGAQGDVQAQAAERDVAADESAANESLAEPASATSAEPPSGSASSDHFDRPKKPCVPLKLNASLDGDEGYTRGTAPLTLEQAQTLMCSSEPIDEALLKKSRAFILKRLQEAGRMKRGRSYYPAQFREVLANFDACVAQIRAAKAKGHIIFDGGPESEIRFKDNGMADLRVGDFNQGFPSGLAGRALLGQGASLCKVRIVDADKQLTGHISVQQKSPGAQ